MWMQIIEFDSCFKTTHLNVPNANYFQKIFKTSYLVNFTVRIIIAIKAIKFIKAIIIAIFIVTITIVNSSYSCFSK